MSEPGDRTSRLGVMLAIAVIAVLAFVMLFDLGGNSDAPADAAADFAETVRGTELQLLAPAGAVDSIRQFAWQSPIRAARYRVIVRSGTTVVWQVETTGLTIAPPPSGVLERDVQYEWRVEAIDGEGHVRMTSPPQPFVNY